MAANQTIIMRPDGLGGSRSWPVSSSNVVSAGDTFTIAMSIAPRPSAVVPVYGFARPDILAAAVGDIIDSPASPSSPGITTLPGFNWNRYRAQNSDRIRCINDPVRGKVAGYSQPVTSGDWEMSQTYNCITRPPENSHFMVGWWARYNAAWNNGQLKIGRLCHGISAINDGGDPDGAGLHHVPMIYENRWHDSGGGYGMVLAHPAYDDNPNARDTWWFGNDVPTNGTWHLNELKVSTGTQGQRNARFARNVLKAGTGVGAFFSSNSISGDGGSYRLRDQMMFYPDAQRCVGYLWQNNFSNGAGSPDFALSDHFFIENSFARVVILDPARPWWREFQPHTRWDWATGEIDIEINPGGLGLGTWELRVYDDIEVDTVIHAEAITIV